PEDLECRRAAEFESVFDGLPVHVDMEVSPHQNFSTRIPPRGPATSRWVGASESLGKRSITSPGEYQDRENARTASRMVGKAPPFERLGGGGVRWWGTEKPGTMAAGSGGSKLSMSREYRVHQSARSPSPNSSATASSAVDRTQSSSQQEGAVTQVRIPLVTAWTSYR